MKHVIVAVHSKEEAKELAQLIEADDGYKYISDYTRAEWHYATARDNQFFSDRPFDACVVGCETRQKEFELKLKFETVHERWKGYTTV